MTIPRGTNLAVDSSLMWDPAIYPDPLVYDGYRFLRLRESGNTWAALAATSPEHITFGIGKSICPGRFFASNEVKIALAKILLTYDVRIPEGAKPEIFEMGFEMLSDPSSNRGERPGMNYLNLTNNGIDTGTNLSGAVPCSRKISNMNCRACRLYYDWLHEQLS